MEAADIRLSVLNNFKLRHAKLLLAIERHGSLLHAAKTLNISQPTASKLLKTLEANLGVNLFNRTNKGIEPTPYGHSLIRHCKPMISQLSHAADELDELAKGHHGHVTVGTLLTGSALVLPTVISRMRKSHPGLTVKIREGTIDLLMDALRNEEIDLIVGRLMVRSMSKNIEQKSLFKGKVCVVANAEHNLASRSRLKLRDAASYGWILPPTPTTLRSQIEKAFRSEGLPPPRNCVESISFLTNRHLLMNTDLLGLFPYHVIEADVKKGALAELPITLPFSDDSYGIIYRKDTYPHPGAVAFTGELQKFAKELARFE